MTTNHRQDDPEFQDLLMNTRKGTLTATDKMTLEQIRVREKSPDTDVHIFQQNDAVDNYNQTQLNLIKSPSRSYTRTRSYKSSKFIRPRDPVTEPYHCFSSCSSKYFPVDTQNIEKEIDASDYARKITLKVGSKVMITKNISVKDGWCNGTICTVIAMNEESILVSKKGTELELKRIPFYKSYYNLKWFDGYKKADPLIHTDKVFQIATFQFPIKLAWGITIHKSQGMTFETCAIHINESKLYESLFYVALSRCKSLAGIDLYKSSCLRYLEIKPKEEVLEYL